MKMYLATILGCLGVLNLVVSYVGGLTGLTYGLVDQGVLMLGAYLGWELDPWIAKRFKGARHGLGILIGALVGNTISDCAGAILDPDMRVMVLGITNGCLIPLLFVPFIEKWKAWREPAQASDERNWDGLIVVTNELGTPGDEMTGVMGPFGECTAEELAYYNSPESDPWGEHDEWLQS